WGTKDILSVLKEMGMVDVTNFSGMTTEPNNLFIGAVFHKAFVEVNEEGTEAAAATAVMGVAGCRPSSLRPARFIADHPFLLRHKKTGAILFIGRIADPVAQ
ncbi:MAG: serpin family protein, partial [Planctomycetota bacterium]